MEEKPFHEKGVADSKRSTIHRLSETRPKFKPVLVKKLLADESDDEESDEPDSHDVNSDEEQDDFDSFQPLSGEGLKEIIPEKHQVKKGIDVKTEDSAVTGCEKLFKDVNINKKSEFLENRGAENKSMLNSLGRDSVAISDLKTIKSEVSMKDKILTVTKQHHSSEQENSTLQSRLSITSSSRVHEIKDRPLQHYDCDVKDVQDKVSGSLKTGTDKMSMAKGIISSSNSISSTVLDTPMKIPHETTRPNPCVSHRNIFQTPQNKMNSEIGKTPQQTPATIFSHWSQNHMQSQTPMQNQIYKPRESLPTPAGNMNQLQNRHEILRYSSSSSSESNTTVRRPLELMTSTSTHHSSQLPKVEEIPNEPSNINQPLKQENVEIQPIYNTSHANTGHKENKNPNTYVLTNNAGSVCNQQKLPVRDAINSGKSYGDSNIQLEYHNVQHQQRGVDHGYKNYQMNQNQSMHPPINQAEQMSRQRTLQSNVPCFPKLNRVISVNNSQYLVLGKLGQGMSCEVLWVYDPETADARAVKVVDLRKMDKEAAKGCLQEIVMLDKLRAPCIVHMFTYQVVQPMVYVVMEVGDTDLSRLVKSMMQEKKKIPLTTILYYWIDMLTAVQHIHRKGTIHSDLKPANFLFVRGRLKLIDFGIASNLNADMTSVLKDSAIGTLNYISPEALLDVNIDSGNNDSPDHKVKYKISYTSDVWSLGCILYQLIYGTTPFSHIRQQWAKIRTITDPKHKINYPVSNGSDSVPLILIEVMKKCLQYDPKKRPTVTELLEVPYLQSNDTSKNESLNSNISIKKILLKIKSALTKEEWDKFSEDYSIVPTMESKNVLLKIKTSLTVEEWKFFTDQFW